MPTWPDGSEYDMGAHSEELSGSGLGRGSSMDAAD